VRGFRLVAMVLAFAVVLFVTPGAWSAAGTLTSFGCGYASGVNGSVNSVPQIVGWTSDKTTYGFYNVPVTNPTAGCGSEFNVAGSTDTRIIGVGRGNVLVGYYKTGSGGAPWNSFVSLNGAAPATFSVGASAYTRAAGVANAGSDATHVWVVGQYQANGSQHGFAVQFNVTNTPPTISLGPYTFDITGATSTGPNGINDSGQIVGGFSDSSNVKHGFLTTLLAVQSGRYVSASGSQIDCSGAGGTNVYGISDSSGNGSGGPLIVGAAVVSNTVNYAFYAPAATGTISCTSILAGSGSGQAWASAIDTAGQWIVGHGTKQGAFVYQVY
jgi:hypothetical protein